MALIRRAAQSVGVQAHRLPPPVSSLTSIVSGIAGQGQTFSPSSSLAAMGSYVTVGWLFAAVSRIAESVAQTEWQLYRGFGDKRVEVRDHPAIDLWNKPNPFGLHEEFIEALVQHFLLVGEMWIHVLDNVMEEPAELWPIRPDLIFPVPDPEKVILGYLYKSGRDGIPLQEREVISYIRRNPIDPLRGAGVVQAIMSDIEGERAASLWNRNFFFNSAEPGGIIEIQKKITPQEFDEMVLQWREQHQGIGNAHRVAFLTQGVWKDRKLSQRDMQFENMRRLNRDVILGAFGMPIPILGIVENVNRANAEAAEVLFGRWVVMPMLKRFRGILNEKILPRYQDGADLQFDFADPVPEHRELNLQIAVQGWESGLLMLNEGRALLDYGNVPDGDKFIPAPPPPPAAPSGGADPGDEKKPPADDPPKDDKKNISTRCPSCNKMMPIGALSGVADVYCRFCKEFVRIDSSNF